MALSATAITTVQRVKDWLWVHDFDPRLQQSGLSLHHDGQGQTSVTVEIRGDSLILVGNVSGTDTRTLTAATDDTLTELAGVLNTLYVPGEGNLIATVLAHGDELSVDLLDIPATSIFGIANRQTLFVTSDRRIEHLIEQTTAEIEQWLDRGIVSRAYTEIVQVGEEIPRQLILREPDLTAVTRVSLDAVDVLDVEYGGADPRASVEVTDTAVVLRSRTGATTTTTTLTFAGNVTLTAMAAAIGVVGGWTASVRSGINGNEPSALLVRSGVLDAQDRQVSLSLWQDYEGAYAVDYEAGIVTLNGGSFGSWWGGGGWGAPWSGQVRVEYTAGFATVPADVEQAALEMIGASWQRQGPTARVEARATGGEFQDLTLTSLRERWQKRLVSYRRKHAWA